MGQSLYHISADHLALMDKIESTEGILTPEIEQALSLTLKDFEDKAVSYGYVIKKVEDEIEAIDKEMARLKTLKQKREKQAFLFRSRLTDAMGQFGYSEIKHALLKLWFRKSNPVEIFNEHEIPEEYMIRKTTIDFNKPKIAQAIKEGKAVPGARVLEKKNLQIT